MARQGSGHIVNTSSAAAFFPDPGNAPYCAAKHAVVGLSLSLRLEGADLGVKVSCVCPGFVRTNIYQNADVINMNLPADVPQGETGRRTCQDDDRRAGSGADPEGSVTQPGADRLSRQHPLGPPRLPTLPPSTRRVPAAADARMAQVPASRPRFSAA